jgi:hypothetical protein
MASKVNVLDEPELEFRYGQKLSRPHTGLSLFGPYDADSGKSPRGISYALIGTETGVADFNKFSQVIRSPVPSPEGKKKDMLWHMFPGFDAAFGMDWPAEPAWVETVNEERLLNAANTRDPYERANKVVSIVLEHLDRTSKRDERPRVLICVVPDHVWKMCRPQQRPVEGVGDPITSDELKSRIRGERNLFDDYDPEVYQLSPDFRRQLKARLMAYDMPVQIVRQSTLAVEPDKKFGYRGLTPLPDRIWNLTTAIYYKCGGKPWRLANARDGVCYIGIAFRLENSTVSSKNGCCAAQMFLDDGDGVVFVGEYGPWYAPDTKQFHLKPEAAKSLLSGVIETYKQLHGKKLDEVFLHSPSGIDSEEYAGYCAAVPRETKVVAVRVRPAATSLRVMRNGAWPVLRGSCLQISDRAGFLWTSGFKPELATYDGSDMPIPLSISIDHGEANFEQVCKDIYGLTKLNYNACRLGDSDPVTVKFSNSVGEILISNPAIETRKPQFRYYI